MSRVSRLMAYGGGFVYVRAGDVRAVSTRTKELASNTVVAPSSDIRGSSNEAQPGNASTVYACPQSYTQACIRGCSSEVLDDCQTEFAACMQGKNTWAVSYRYEDAQRGACECLGRLRMCVTDAGCLTLAEGALTVACGMVNCTGVQCQVRGWYLFSGCVHVPSCVCVCVCVACVHACAFVRVCLGLFFVTFVFGFVLKGRVCGESSPPG
jgi:hypothetical protein